MPDVVRVIIPGSVETIPTDAFRMHRVLQEVVVKEGVIEVGENAFLCCESLEQLAHVSLFSGIYPGRTLILLSKSKSEMFHALQKSKLVLIQSKRG